MNLSEASTSIVAIRLVCADCGAQQPVGVKKLVERFTPEAELEVALKLHRCMFCDQMGRFNVKVRSYYSA